MYLNFGIKYKQITVKSIQIKSEIQQNGTK